MGEVFTELRLIGPAGRSETIKRIIVDTGADLTYLNPDRVKRIGANMICEKAPVSLGDQCEKYGPIYSIEIADLHIPGQTQL